MDRPRQKRMPTIVNDEVAWEWMMTDLTDERFAEIASTQFAASEMEVCTIAPQFLGQLDPTEPFVYADLPALELNL